MTFDPEERTLLAAIADVLIPAGEGFPAASQAGVATHGLDQVLAVRPDLGEGSKRVLLTARHRRLADSLSPSEGERAGERGHIEASKFIAELQRIDPAGFAVLAELVPAAYFLDPDVNAKLGYKGQTPKPIDPRPDYLDDGLLQSVLDRGSIFRPTPDDLR